MVNPFWKKRRVFLTGHTGFKGAWLSLWMQHMGASLTGYSIDIPTQPSLFEIAGIGRGMNSITGDVRDISSLRTELKRTDPHVVIHFAAQSLVKASYWDPVATFETNAMGTVNLLEACRGLPSLRAILVVTSDKCYDNKEWARGYREDDPLGGRDPYSSSKAAAEIVTASYRSSFFDSNESAFVAT